LQDEGSPTASVVSGFQQSGTFSDDQLSVLLDGFTTGAINKNPGRDSSNLEIDIGKNFANVRSISVVSPDRVVTASSNHRVHRRADRSSAPGRRRPEFA